MNDLDIDLTTQEKMEKSLQLLKQNKLREEKLAIEKSLYLDVI